jgi:hypothetical protein
MYAKIAGQSETAPVCNAFGSGTQVGYMVALRCSVGWAALFEVGTETEVRPGNSTLGSYADRYATGGDNCLVRCAFKGGSQGQTPTGHELVSGYVRAGFGTQNNGSPSLSSEMLIGNTGAGVFYEGLTFNCIPPSLNSTLRGGMTFEFAPAVSANLLTDPTMGDRYQCLLTYDSGDPLTTGVVGTWQVLSTEKEWTLVRPGNAPGGYVFNGTLYIRDTATQTVQDQCAIAMTAYVI